MVAIALQSTLAAPCTARERISVDVDSLTPPEWDQVAVGFDDLNLFQTAAYADALRRSKCLSHIILRENGLPLAGARVAIRKPLGLFTGVAYVKHGPFWRRAGSQLDQDVYRAAIGALLREYAHNRGHLVTVSPRPDPRFKMLEEQLLLEAGFVRRKEQIRPITYFLVNTGLPRDQLKASLSGKWRYNLKAAERNGL